ncbi:hypothetical protein [Aeromonas caviae]|uniref:hypothetical protein n=1 Tax=Aeromonas caviae TaxID=648 RepID=UPI002F41A448
MIGMMLLADRHDVISQQEISDELNKATLQLANPESKVKALDWKELVEHGFDDIDPQGYFTGKHPKLRGK